MTTTTAGSGAAATIDGGPPADGAAAPARRRLGAALVVLGALIGAGVGLGVGWALLAPTVPCIVIDGNCQYEAYHGGRFFIAEGMFALLTFVAGTLAAFLVRRWVRELGWPVVVALAVGSALASIVAWRVGVWLGPDDPNTQSLAEGSVAELPLQLHATGLLLVGSIGALLVTLATALLADDPDDHEPDAPRLAPDPDELAAWIQKRD